MPRMVSGNRGGGAIRARTIAATVPLSTGLLTTVSTFGLLAPVAFAKTGGSSNLSIGASTGAISAAAALTAGASQSLAGTATGADGCVLPFTVTLTGAGAVVAPAPSLSLSSALTQAEGNSGTAAFAWTLTLNRDGSTAAFPFNWAVTGNGSSPADAADFGGSLPSGSGTFAAGETTKMITVLVMGDTAVEPAETFLFTVTAAGLNTVTSTGTISNDDVAVALPQRLATMNHRMSSVRQSAASGRLRMVSTTPHPVCGRYTDLRFVYANKQVTNGTPSEVDGSNSVAMWKLAAQIGSTVVPILFGGSRTATLAVPTEASPVLVADPILPAAFGLSEFTASNAAGLLHRAAADVAANGLSWPVIISAGAGSFARIYDPTVDTTWDQVDSPTAMTAPSGATVTGNSYLGPIAILGTCAVTGQRAILILGDSIAVGAGDSTTSAGVAGPGFLTRAAYGDGSAPIACTIIGKVSMRSDEYQVGNALRRWLAKYITHEVEDYYTNDYATSPNLSPAQVVASKRYIWRDMRRAGVQRLLTTNTVPKLTIGHLLTAVSYDSATGVATFTTDSTAWMTGQAVFINGVATGFNGSSTSRRTDYTVLNGTQFQMTFATGLTSPTLGIASIVDDARTTVAGQPLDTKWQPGGEADALDALYAAEVGTQIDRLIDIKSAVVDPTDTHRYKADGTAYKWMVPDGSHPSETSNIAMAVPTRAAYLADPVDANAAAPQNVDPPVSTAATYYVGRTVGFDDGGWRDVYGATKTYQWKRAGTAIVGATSPTYQLQPADAGQAITRDLTMTTAGYSPATVTSTLPYVWPAPTGTAFIADLMNDYPAVSLAAHTSDSGATYSAHPTAPSSRFKLTDPYTGRAYSDQITSKLVASSVPASADQTGFALIDNLSVIATQRLWLMLRYDPTADTGYGFGYNRSTGQWQVVKFVTGTLSTIASFTATLTVGQLSSLRGRVEGTGATVTLVLSIEGTDVITATDTAGDRIVAAGRLGLVNTNVLAGAMTGLGFQSIVGVA